MILRCQGFVTTLGMTSNELVEFLTQNCQNISRATTQQVFFLLSFYLNH